MCIRRAHYMNSSRACIWYMLIDAAVVQLISKWATPGLQQYV